MNYTHLTKDVRNEISILLKRGYSQRNIAHALGKDHSSISREIKRNSVNGIYDPQKANHKAIVKKINSKYHGMKIRKNNELEKYIIKNIKKFWSPEQIAGVWNKMNKKDELENPLTITHKTIYKYLYSAYGEQYCCYLTTKRIKPKKRRKLKNKREIIKNRVFIDKRPNIINERKRFGDWEGDTMGRIKSDKKVVAGIIERKSRYFKIELLPQMKYTVDGFNKMLNPHRRTLHSVTLDNGVENKRYEELKVKTFFCNPYSSWEKGSIENSFKRLRRFIPKKSSIQNLTNKDIKSYQNIMNNTPRKCLEYKTPKQVFMQNYYNK